MNEQRDSGFEALTQENDRIDRREPESGPQFIGTMRGLAARLAAESITDAELDTILDNIAEEYNIKPERMLQLLSQHSVYLNPTTRTHEIACGEVRNAMEFAHNNGIPVNARAIVASTHYPDSFVRYVHETSKDRLFDVELVDDATHKELTKERLEKRAARLALTTESRHDKTAEIAAMASQHKEIIKKILSIDDLKDPAFMESIPDKMIPLYENFIRNIKNVARLLHDSASQIYYMRKNDFLEEFDRKIRMHERSTFDLLPAYDPCYVSKEDVYESKAIEALLKEIVMETLVRNVRLRAKAIAFRLVHDQEKPTLELCRDIIEAQTGMVMPEHYVRSLFEDISQAYVNAYAESVERRKPWY